jgi:hypothetical protein
MSKKFKITFGISLIHHVSVIILPIFLFLTYNNYNIVLGIVWMAFRIGEGLILVIIESNYWDLLDIARKYSNTDDKGKKSLDKLNSCIILRKSNRFKLGMVFWAIGTLIINFTFLSF